MPEPTFEITFQPQPDGRYLIAAHFRAPEHDDRAVATTPSAFDALTLRQASDDPAAYGRALTDQVFTDPTLRAFWGQCRAVALQHGPFAVRLRLGPGDAALHALRWETLRDPEDDQPLALSQRIRLARTLDGQDLTPIAPAPRPAALSALVAVAAPSDITDYGLAEVDADGEVGRARAALGSITPTVLGDVAGAAGRATLEELIKALEAGPTIVVLVAHGGFDDASQPVLYLEDADGLTVPTPGDALIAAIGRLATRPRLLILVSCKGAGDDYAALTAIGPRLAQQGIPAVLAFQGDIAMAATKRLLPRLLEAVQADGQVDRALASARAALGSGGPWWQPVLFLRGDGRLWVEEFRDDQIGTQTIIMNVWQWEGFAADVLHWLTKQLERKALAEAEREKAEQEQQKQWAQIDWSQKAQEYRKEMLRLYGSMQIFGMNQPVPLADVFTDVYLLDKPNAWRHHSIDEMRTRFQMRTDITDKDGRREGKILVTQKPHLFILGQPGAGKTTFLKHLVMQAVQGKLDAIPLFVPLKAWSDSKLDLISYLVHLFTICNFPDAQAFIETVLTDGKALVLFDGLDEVSYEGREHQRITEAIRAFTQQYGQSRVVLTCRTAATEYTFEGFSYCELADFTQQQIETFVTRWFQQDPLKRVAFLNDFGQPENERLGELARRPLLLTMLCLTFEETMAFPHRRAELYEEAIDALLKKWDASRSIQRDQIYRKLSLGYKRQMLTELAAETFEHSEFFMAKRDLTPRIVRFLRRLPPIDQNEDIDGEAVLRAIEAQHGLLIARARDVYSFSHMTFHEYFAARYLADHPNERTLNGAIKQAANPQWREVLLLAASMLDHYNAQHLFSLWINQLHKQIQADQILTELINWVAEQAEISAAPSSSTRAAVLALTIVDQALLTSQGIAIELENLHNLTRDPDLTRALDTIRMLSLDHTNDHTFNKGLDHTLTDALDRVFSFANALTLAHDRTRTLARALGLDLDRTISRASTNASVSANAGIGAKASINIYRWCLRNESSTVNLLQHTPQKNWHLTSKQLDILGRYLISTERLLECLDLATIENREAIISHLLRMPR